MTVLEYQIFHALVLFYTIDGSVYMKGFHTINGGTSESATEIRGAPGITRDVGFTAYSYKVQILILY